MRMTGLCSRSAIPLLGASVRAHDTVFEFASNIESKYVGFSLNSGGASKLRCESLPSYDDHVVLARQIIGVAGNDTHVCEQGFQDINLLVQKCRAMSLECLMTVVRYIYRNPVKAGMTSGCSYKWSSYDSYASGRPPVGGELVMALFGGVGSLVLFHEQDTVRA